MLGSGAASPQAQSTPAATQRAMAHGAGITIARGPQHGAPAPSAPQSHAQVRGSTLYPQRKFTAPAEPVVDTSRGLVAQATDIIVGNQEYSMRLAVGLAFASLTGTVLTDSIGDNVKNGKEATEAELRAASEPSKSAVWLFASGAAATGAIASVEVLRRLASGLHTVIEIGTSYSVRTFEASESGLNAVSVTTPEAAVRIKVMIDSGVTGEDKAHSGYTTPLPVRKTSRKARTADASAESTAAASTTSVAPFVVSSSIESVPLTMESAWTEPSKAGRGAGGKRGRAGHRAAGGYAGGGGGYRGGAGRGGYRGGEHAAGGGGRGAGSVVYGGGYAAPGAYGVGAPMYGGGAVQGSPGAGGYGYATAGGGFIAGRQPPQMVVPIQQPRYCVAYDSANHANTRMFTVLQTFTLAQLTAEACRAFGVPAGAAIPVVLTPDRTAYMPVADDASLARLWAAADAPGANGYLQIFMQPASPAPPAAEGTSAPGMA